MSKSVAGKKLIFLKRNIKAAKKAGSGKATGQLPLAYSDDLLRPADLRTTLDLCSASNRWPIANEGRAPRLPVKNELIVD